MIMPESIVAQRITKSLFELSLSHWGFGIVCNFTTPTYLSLSLQHCSPGWAMSFSMVILERHPVTFIVQRSLLILSINLNTPFADLTPLSILNMPITSLPTLNWNFEPGHFQIFLCSIYSRCFQVIEGLFEVYKLYVNVDAFFHYLGHRKNLLNCATETTFVSSDFSVL